MLPASCRILILHDWLRRQGALAQAVCLGGICLAAYCVVAPAFAVATGPAAWASSAVAAGACLLGAWGGILPGVWLAGPERVLHRALSGMTIRLAIPMASFMVLRSSPADWAPNLLSHGFSLALVAFYVVLLAAETLLTLPASSFVKSPSAS